MEPDPHTPSAPDEPTARPHESAAEPGAEHSSSGPTFSTPVIVAMLSLGGVLGGSLFSNWDKIFGGGHHSAKPAVVVAESSSLKQPASSLSSSSMAALQGVWLSPVVQHPYQPDRFFKLRLELNTAGGELTGRVSDVVAGSSSGASAPASEILSPRAVADGIDFQIASRWCCEDGKERPYETFYQVRPTSQGLAVTRRNNAPGGGQVERFLLSRSD